MAPRRCAGQSLPWPHSSSALLAHDSRSTTVVKKWHRLPRNVSVPDPADTEQPNRFARSGRPQGQIGAESWPTTGRRMQRRWGRLGPCHRPRPGDRDRRISGGRRPRSRRSRVPHPDTEQQPPRMRSFPSGVTEPNPRDLPVTGGGSSLTDFSRPSPSLLTSSSDDVSSPDPPGDSH